MDARTETGKSLTSFGYIAFGTLAPSAFAKKVADAVPAYLRSAGHLSGKRCYAFVGKKGLRKNRILASLMKSMEAEGMYLKRSDVLASTAEAEAVGRRLHIEKSSSPA